MGRMARLGMLLVAVGLASLGLASTQTATPANGVWAATAVATLAVGVLFAGWGLGGDTGLRVSGGLVAAAAFGLAFSLVTAYWQPSNWSDPLWAVAWLLGGLSLLVLLFGAARWPRLGGLSATCGLLALGCYLLTVLPISTNALDEDLVALAAIPLGALAVIFALGVAAKTSVGHQIGPYVILAVAALGLGLLVQTADEYIPYQDQARRTVIANVLLWGGVAGLLAAAVVLGVLPLRHPHQRPGRPADIPSRPAPGKPSPTRPPESDIPTPLEVGTEPSQPHRSIAAPAADRPSSTDPGQAGRLQTLAALVGLITGLWTFGKDIATTLHGLLR